MKEEVIGGTYRPWINALDSRVGEYFSTFGLDLKKKKGQKNSISVKSNTCWRVEITKSRELIPILLLLVVFSKTKSKSLSYHCSEKKYESDKSGNGNKEWEKHKRRRSSAGKPNTGA